MIRAWRGAMRVFRERPIELRLNFFVVEGAEGVRLAFRRTSVTVTRIGLSQ